MSTRDAQPTSEQKIGLGYWMKEVLKEADHVSNDFSPDAVHDLRTALRRCRSMADGLMTFDPDPAWKKMKKAGKQLFSSLGELRDIHVLGDWVQQLAPKDDLAGKILVDYVAEQEQVHKSKAADALRNFDPKQWSRWANDLPARAAHIPPGSPMFAHLALEKWTAARTLHRTAMHNRSSVAYHQLRIGLKRFRYIVENFLPNLYQQWGKDLKHLQDELGDVHDFDVLWNTAMEIDAFADPQIRAAWRQRLNVEREKRIAAYREKMAGPHSLWHTWRAALPKTNELRGIALERLQTWASFLDPDGAHARHVSTLALQLYDELAYTGVIRRANPEARQVLEAAALMHDVGRAKSKKSHHKESARLIRKLSPPLGWTVGELRVAALIARYHRGALPRDTHKNFAPLSKTRKQRVLLLGGILRLACACDREHEQQIRSLRVEALDNLLEIRAQGLSELSSTAEQLASARYLLEVACQRPAFIVPMGVEGQLIATKQALGAA
jgi:CHAD domain-containing protein